MNNFHHKEADQVKQYFTRKTRKTVIVESLVRIDEHSVMRMRGSCVSSLCTALAEAGSPDGKHYYYIIIPNNGLAMLTVGLWDTAPVCRMDG